MAKKLKFLVTENSDNDLRSPKLLFEALTGYSAEELGKIGISRFFGENSEAGDFLTQVLTGQNHRADFETKIITKAAENKWVAVTLTPFGGLPSQAFLGRIYSGYLSCLGCSSGA
jgi:PAS domain-containing protein